MFRNVMADSFKCDYFVSLPMTYNALVMALIAVAIGLSNCCANHVASLSSIRL